MKTRWFILLLIVIPVLLTACSRDTTISFKNDAECGNATLTLTNSESGNERVYTMTAGQKVDINVENAIPYRYKVEYERLPGSVQCDEKSGTIMLPNKGDSASFTLQSVTPTPEPETSSQ